MNLLPGQILVILYAAREEGNELHCKRYRIRKFGDEVSRRCMRRARIVQPNVPLVLAIGHQGMVLVIRNVDGQARVEGM